MELFSTPDNPAPDGGAAAEVRTRDNIRLRAARWAPQGGSPTGTVLLLQGRAEMIEKYFETIADLLARGFQVATFDWRGQGGSDRLLADPRKGHVGDFNDYEEDLRAVIEAVLAPHCPKPWFGLSHSMGGCVALSALYRKSLPIEKLVCIAPMIAIHDIGNPTGVLWLARTLRAIGLGGRYIPGGGATSIATKPFAGNPLSSDPARYARNARIASDFVQLAIGDPTIAWTRAAFARMADLARPGYAAGIPVPTLVVAAGDERVVSTPATEAFAAQTQGKSMTIAGARHEILMEKDALRAEFFSALDDFLARRAG